MKENEFDIFDIQVRNLMAEAEESVSPDVWKGVEAGLDRAARKRVVPVWLWRGLAAAAVAAAAAAFVLLRPAQNLSNQPTIQQPVAQATDAPLPAATQPEEDDVTPVAPVTPIQDIPDIQEQAKRLHGRVAQVVDSPATPAATEEPAIPEQATDQTAVQTDQEPATRRPDTVIDPDTVVAPDAEPQESFVSDEDAFRQLAFEEQKARRKGGLSMGVLGNIQSNTRPDAPTSTVRRSPGFFVMPAPTETKISREGTEFSFGLPVSAGISLRYDFSPRWGIGTGVVYTNLSRSFLGDYQEVENGEFTKKLFDTDITNQQHYIGIPVNVFFNIVNTGSWNFHARMDGMGEKLVDNHFLIHDSEGDIHLHQKAQGLQFSAGLGIGVEFKFSPHVGIYFDPTLRYYFNGNQPRSIRTIQPLRMDFEAGVRFSLGK